MGKISKAMKILPDAMRNLSKIADEVGDASKQTKKALKRVDKGPSTSAGKGAKGKSTDAAKRAKDARKAREAKLPKPVRKRVKLRAETKREVYRKARRHPNGDFRCAATGERIPAARNADGSLVRIDPATGRPSPNGMTVPEPGSFHFGHKPGHEWATYKKEAIDGKYTRPRVIEDQNVPGNYRVEKPEANVSHKFEAK